VGEGNYQNLQVSSRTDRGVHALKNTFHVDLRERLSSNVVGTTSTISTPLQFKEKTKFTLHPLTIQHALNFYLRSPQTKQKGCTTTTRTRNYRENGNDIRVLTVVPAPLQHTYYYRAQGYTPSSSLTDTTTTPYYVGEWNARFTATQRRYVYRILTGYNANEGFNTLFPFEWDRAWFIPRRSTAKELDTSLMQEAANYLIGTQDFTSFRGKNCQRSSPITTISELSIYEDNNYFPSSYIGYSSSALQEQPSHQSLRLITISVTGTSFLYRQVRNIVGCLVYVGQGRVTPLEVQRILHDKNRNIAPPTAPAHALFLVDVKHEGLTI
jgi:tRNA pseudouridine(38-40) synthase